MSKIEYLKSCPNCLNSFKTFYKNKKYCSAECRAECKQIKYINAYKKKKFPKRKCKVCNREFWPRVAGHKFCSLVCRNQNYRNQNPVLHSKLLFWRILNRDNFQCQYCGRTPTKDGIKLHIDHIKPQADGGKTEMNNLVTSCELCNLLKSARPLRHEAEFKKRLQNKVNPINLKKDIKIGPK